MTDSRWFLLIAAGFGGAGVWLSLPRGRAGGRALGGLLGATGLGVFAAALPGLSDWMSQSVFWVLAAVTVVSAAAAMTFRNPVYCAIWFGLSLAGTAGLFFFQGAQFLAVATIVVYAGAILVTFLFILMLAQPSGRARYDRVSWEGLLSAACGAFFVGVLSTTVTSVLASPEAGRDAPKITQHDREQVILSEQHVKQIGTRLFSRYLVAVELAGVLLLAALVGAAVIVGRARGPLVGPAPPADRNVTGGAAHG
jgi:NADH-quinone oxidoreductase subunit J